jgi:hypothetical protein
MTWEAEIEGLWLQVSQKLKFVISPISLKKRLDVVAYTCHPSYSRKHKGGES